MLNEIKQKKIWYEYLLFFKDWSAFLIFLFFANLIGAIGILIYSCITSWGWMPWVDFFTNLVYVICIILAARAKVANYIWGLIAVILYGGVAFLARNTGTWIMSWCFNIPMQIWGFFLWFKNSKNKIDVKPKSLKTYQAIVVIIVCLGLIGLFGWVFSLAQVQNFWYGVDDSISIYWSVLDSAVMVTAILGMFLMIFRYREQWIIWVIGDAISVALWIVVLDPTMILLWVTSTINSVYGLYFWYKSYKENKMKPNERKMKMSLKLRIVSAFFRMITRWNWFNKKFGTFQTFAAKYLPKKKSKVPKNYTLEKLLVENIPIEITSFNGSKNKDKVIFLIHGGGFEIPLCNLYRKMAIKYCNISNGANVVNLDYSVLPEHKFPIAQEQCYKVYKYLLTVFKPENIIIFGDSAGGNLALELTAKIRDENKKLIPKGLILFSPWTDLAATGQSYQTNLDYDPLFGKKKKVDLDKYEIHLKKIMCEPYANGHLLNDKWISPLYQEYKNFPNMLIQIGNHEMLFDDSKGIYDKAIKNNVNVKLTGYNYTFHVFQLFNFKESKVAWKEVEDYIIDLWNLNETNNHNCDLTV